jgi:hypothetical protein
MARHLNRRTPAVQFYAAATLVQQGRHKSSKLPESNNREGDQAEAGRLEADAFLYVAISHEAEKSRHIPQTRPAQDQL